MVRHTACMSAPTVKLLAYTLINLTSYKINGLNSVSESWTGIGVVASCAAVMLITQEPHVKNIAAHWIIKLFHILQ